MKQELQEKLFQKYPKIFRQKSLSPQETAMCWGISCGDGWYHIIDTLCASIQHVVDYPREQVEYYHSLVKKEREKDEKDQDKKLLETYEDSLYEYEKQVIDQIEAVQVKEKFGSLRFYVTGYPVNDKTAARITAYISFAELLSSRTCEICGAPGMSQSEGWIKTRCKEHEGQRR